jgi:hypothetical protein
MNARGLVINDIRLVNASLIERHKSCTDQPFNYETDTYNDGIIIKAHRNGKPVTLLFGSSEWTHHCIIEDDKIYHVNSKGEFIESKNAFISLKTKKYEE